jgi:hypothetical protein
MATANQEMTIEADGVVIDLVKRSVSREGIPDDHHRTGRGLSLRAGLLSALR